MATVQRCASCTAPLPILDTPPGATIRCRFCGADNRTGVLPVPAPAPAPQPAPPRPPVASDAPASDAPAPPLTDPARPSADPPASPAAVRGCLLGALVVVGAVIAIVVWATRPLSLDRLSETPSEGEGWISIAAPAPPGDFDRFDPAAGVPWAQRIARAWARDAVLTYVSVAALRRDGTADVVTASTEDTTGPSVWYHFVSPARVADYHRRATRAELKVNYALVIQLRDGRVQVLRSLDTPRTDEVPTASLPPRLCPLSRAVAAVLKAHKLPERPMYEATLNARAGYEWSLDTRDHHGSVMVRGDTCEPK
jgi:hypothetical protein